ncbi:hypothetical protein H0H92_004611 [Tricholoma furcatifolium]|nr:hypothetical protein H0H92_004611 [Tricholoma furcatifolium]
MPAPEDLTDEEVDDTIDPELRLRTVRTAASAIAESIKSEQRAERRKGTRTRSRFFRRNTTAKKPQLAPAEAGPSKVPGVRRNVYVNHPLSAMEVDQNGEPVVRYQRNKVRTTMFPIFGAASGSISVLPLAFILAVTAIKDGIEDYRRGVLDQEVNNSATTKLAGGWANVNQPTDPRSWLEKLFGINAPGKVSRGVKKLRDREAGQAGAGIKVMLSKAGESRASLQTGPDSSSVDLVRRNRRLEDIHSIDSHSYPPPAPGETSQSSFGDSSTTLAKGSMSQYQQSIHSQSTVGVIDWQKRVPGSARWERTLWKKLEVGDIVLLRDNEQVPADIVVLSTSDPDSLCYLETKNLDGETNLKPRKAVRGTSSLQSEEDIERSSFYLDSEPPHQNLYLYHGILRYKDTTNGEQKQESVTINELLLRGCTLRNTNWVIGLVVFTGADTKIMLNGGDTPSKRSKIEKETNFNVFVNFGVLTAMCLIAAIINGVWDAQSGTSASYFEQGTDPTSSSAINAIVTFVYVPYSYFRMPTLSDDPTSSCLIAFQNIVPISLYISIEIVKTIQAYFISQDVDMYYKPFDTPCIPKTWNISDDLGQIEYVFSDKTGTLTQNVMEFQKCSVHGVTYGEGVTEAQRGAATREGKGDIFDPAELNEKLASLKQQMLNVMERTFKNRYLQADKMTLVSPQLAEDLTDRSSDQRAHLIAFFRALAVCHSVLADKPDAQNDPYHLEYKAESPDEAALVAGARDAGFPFINKSKDSMDIEVMGQRERYTLLKMLEFNSTRKRMSVVVRNPEGRLVLYTKGADTVIYARLAKDHDAFLKEKTSKDMETFANSGLRTLCIAYRYLDEDEYMAWSKKYDDATNAIENRDEEIDKANELIEHSLYILGATALEDKLQEGVPEAIDTLHQAGIKLWILTGDKLQTAIEIGFSCNLLKNTMDIMILSADSMEQARAQIEGGLNKIASVLGPPSWDPRKRGFFPGAKASFAVVIDGDTLRHALSPELKELFLNLGTQCETVVCCRVSPAQKALTVKLVKEGRNAMTLSIGDGANDVAMIQEANIGIGLFGLEGSQAAMSADYAFGQFRFLTKLLLVHGRWSYQRIADMHSNFFYKNVIWTLAMFWYLPFNSFDATYLYQYTFVLLCNLVFTSLPVIVLGAFDQDINAKAALAFPQLYVRGIRGLEYTRMKFWLYMFDGLYQSAVIFFVPYLVWTLGISVSWNGKGIESLSDFGTTVAVAAILAANSYVGISTNYWTVITWVSVFGSTIVMMLWIVVYSFFLTSDFIDEVIILFGGITFWATITLSATVALAPRFIIKYAKTVYTPLDKDIVREMWVKGDLKDQLGLGHRRDRKMRKDDQRNLEAAPMFQEQHNRSFSEMSTHHRYEPTSTSSPGPKESTLRPTYLDTPPMSQTNDLPLPNIQYPHGKSHLDQEQHLSPVILDPHPSPTQEMHLSPHPAGNRIDMNPSPQPSFYSASDLPPQSPLPSPKYMYTTGEVTNTPPPPSRRTSIATIRTGQGQRPGSPASLPRHRPPNNLQVPGAPAPEAYEMQARNPSPPNGGYEPQVGYDSSRPASRTSTSHHQHQRTGTATLYHYERSGTSTSFNTNAEEYWTADDDSSVDESGHPRSSDEHDDDDRTIGHDDRHRDSVARTWEGGIAM